MIFQLLLLVFFSTTRGASQSRFVVASGSGLEQNLGPFQVSSSGSVRHWSVQGNRSGSDLPLSGTAIVWSKQLNMFVATIDSEFQKNVSAVQVSRNGVDWIQVESDVVKSLQSSAFIAAGDSSIILCAFSYANTSRPENVTGNLGYISHDGFHWKVIENLSQVCARENKLKIPRSNVVVSS